MQRELTIYVISDSIGETGELIASAAVRQFTESYEIKRYPYIVSEDQIKNIFDEAEVGKSLIIYTTVSEKFRPRPQNLDWENIQLFLKKLEIL